MVELGGTLEGYGACLDAHQQASLSQEATSTNPAIGTKAKCAVSGCSVLRPFPNSGQVEPEMGT